MEAVAALKQLAFKLRRVYGASEEEVQLLLDAAALIDAMETALGLMAARDNNPEVIKASPRG